MSRKNVRHCYALENDGTVSRRPCVVARGMVARREASRMVTNVTQAEAMAILRGGQTEENVLAARRQNEKRREENQKK